MRPHCGLPRPRGMRRSRLGRRPYSGLSPDENPLSQNHAARMLRKRSAAVLSTCKVAPNGSDKLSPTLTSRPNSSVRTAAKAACRGRPVTCGRSQIVIVTPSLLARQISTRTLSQASAPTPPASSSQSMSDGSPVRRPFVSGVIAMRPLVFACASPPVRRTV